MSRLAAERQLDRSVRRTQTTCHRAPEIDRQQATGRRDDVPGGLRRSRGPTHLAEGHLGHRDLS